MKLDERERNEKRFCLDRGEFQWNNDEKIMRNLMTKKIQLCVENLTKILNESSSNTPFSLLSLTRDGDHQGRSSSKLFKHRFDCLVGNC